MAFAAVCSNAVVQLLFIVSPIACVFVFDSCFVMQYFMSFLVYNHLGGQERDSWLLYSYCLLYVMWLLLSFDTSSRCCQLVYSVVVWRFLVIHTNF